MPESDPGLVLLWTSQDPETARNMVYMYAANSLLKGWWHRVRVVVWGPSAGLLAEDAELQDELEELKAAGVELLACRRCADNYGVAETLEGLGIEVIYMGDPMTRMLKQGWTCLSV